MAGDHHHHGHSHGHGHAHGSDDSRRVAIAFVLIATFMVVEVAGGVLSGSLALLADAGHMVSDAVALGMSWAAFHIGRRPADASRSYGYRRLEVLAAFVNGCTLFVIAGWVVFEAVRRFAEPVPVLGGTMLAVAIAGLLANLAAFAVLHGGNRENLNLRSAWLHVLGDVLGFVVAIAGAIAIMATGWYPIDPILSVIVALIILKSAWDIVRSSAHILLEGTPPGIDPEEMREALSGALPDGLDVHHVHVWSLTAERTLATLHVRGETGDHPETIIARVRRELQARYGIAHSTVQIERQACADAAA